MSGETDDADGAADRLEAALERLAMLTGTHRSASDHERAPPEELHQEQAQSAVVDEIAARLDGLIDRLRAALGGRA